MWIDVEGIPGGKNWLKAVENAIEMADWLIVLLSPSSNDSQWVQREVLYALGLEKRILPVMVQPSTPPLLLSYLQYLDLTQNFDEGLNKILEIIRRRSEPEKTGETPPPPEEIARQRLEFERQPVDRVFIAYSRKQRRLAKDLSELLNKHKKPSFYDAHIRAGARWRQIIQKALDDATHVVVIWTLDAAASDEVEREVSYALAESKYIIPILSKETPKLPYHLHGLQYIVLEQDLSSIEHDLIAAINLYKRDDDIWH